MQESTYLAHVHNAQNLYVSVPLSKEDLQVCQLVGTQSGDEDGRQLGSWGFTELPQTPALQAA